jgi:hypothetical protein
MTGERDKMKKEISDAGASKDEEVKNMKEDRDKYKQELE